MEEQFVQSTIYVGLNDSVTGTQLYDKDKYISILHTVCRNYHVPFSLRSINGGYFHEDGRFTNENTLVITLMGTPEETVTEIATDLCVFFHQESVLVTTAPCSYIFIKASLED